MNKLVRILLLLILFPTVLKSDSHRDVDSLINLLSHKLSDTLRVNVLNTIAHAVIDFPDSSMFYAKSASALAGKINYPSGVARSTSNIGEVYNAKGNYNLALKNFYEAYHIYEGLGNKKAMNSVMNSIGNTHLGNNNNDKALEAFKRCYSLGRESNDSSAMALSSFGIGNIYGTVGKMDSAMRYLNFSLPLFAKQKYTYAEAMTYTLIGQLQATEKKFDESLRSLARGMELFKKIDQAYGISVTYQSIGKTFEDMGDKKKALENYILAYEMNLKRNAYDNLKESCASISSLYKKMGDYKNSLIFHEQYMNFKDSVFNEQSRKQLLEVETRYQTDKKEKQIKLKNLELEKSNEEVKNRTLFLYVSLGVSVIFLLMSFFVFIQYKEKKKANSEIILQKNVIEEKNKSITDSIRYAQYIQESILPDDDMTYQLLRESFVLYRPKDIVSGDFYWIASVGDSTYIAVVDCTGHGVPGAFMSMIGHNALRNAVKEGAELETAKILSFLQKEVVELFKNNYNSSSVRDGMDISLIRINRKNMKLQFSGANNPLCIIQNDKLLEYKGDKMGISAHKENADFVFKTHEIDIHKGDSIYLFSDGYADQFGGSRGKKFKYKQFQQLLLDNSAIPMNEQRKVFDNTFEAWRGNLEQVDDILIIGIRA